MLLQRAVFLAVFAAALLVAGSAFARKSVPRPVDPITRLEALEQAPPFIDAVEQERGQRLADEACRMTMSEAAVCDLVIKDSTVDALVYRRESGIIKTSIRVMDILTDNELRAAFVWAILYERDGLRDKAVKYERDRVRNLEALGKVNPSVGVGGARGRGPVSVGVGVVVGPEVIIGGLNELAKEVEETKLLRQYKKIDEETMRLLRDAGHDPASLLCLLAEQESRSEDKHRFLQGRAAGLGKTGDARRRSAVKSFKKLTGQDPESVKCPENFLGSEPGRETYLEF